MEIITKIFENFNEFETDFKWLFQTEDQNLLKLNQLQDMFFINEETILLNIFLPRKNILLQIVLNNLKNDSIEKIYNLCEKCYKK